MPRRATSAAMTVSRTHDTRLSGRATQDASHQAHSSPEVDSQAELKDWYYSNDERTYMSKALSGEGSNTGDPAKVSHQDVKSTEGLEEADNSAMTPVPGRSRDYKSTSTALAGNNQIDHDDEPRTKKMKVKYYNDGTPAQESYHPDPASGVPTTSHVGQRSSITRWIQEVKDSQIHEDQATRGEQSS
ncbi:hypothetical protein I302_108043 [Kwoniella bestiolae CBS 10118]|uniref:Uncharacterized protein n=1 Tax=Kwoniella bestiolae CBS 10118 TaxID=1296100 RepID=A0A1B9FWU1_9TREE|nr:hypothetical protein I302_07591 [Kwoniella bestiolae CBS 10118]OCF23237.1 hypothetical protein I302_07591 [Kwoniella bestiolae CBS 10118]